jgi:hypothetical protein
MIDDCNGKLLWSQQRPYDILRIACQWTSIIRLCKPPWPLQWHAIPQPIRLVIAVKELQAVKAEHMRDCHPLELELPHEMQVNNAENKNLKEL